MAAPASRSRQVSGRAKSRGIRRTGRNAQWEKLARMAKGVGPPLLAVSTLRSMPARANVSAAHARRQASARPPLPSDLRRSSCTARAKPRTISFSSETMDVPHS